MTSIAKHKFFIYKSIYKGIQNMLYEGGPVTS